ncbi:MAG: ABC-2 family transporter protein [Anaerolineales bacterium]|nr:ABC-2 family transporter protein [Anaerolineales bacterium]
MKESLRGLPQLGRIYQQQFKTMTAVHLQYRAAVVIWLIGLVIEPVVYLVVWTNVARASGGTVNGFTESTFAAYFIVSMITNHLTFTWHFWEYDYRIREGLLSPMLLRPLHPIHADFAENLSYKVITLIVVVPTTVALTLAFQPDLVLTTRVILAYVPALVLAFSVQFLWGWALAMAAFWTTRISAIIRMYFLGKLFLAGQLAPLALLPLPLQVLASWTPYRWMLSFPVEVLLGRVPAADVWWGLAAQAAWTALGIVAVRLVWRAGIKRYAAFGA